MQVIQRSLIRRSLFSIFVCLLAFAMAGSLNASAQSATPIASAQLASATSWLVVQQASDGGFVGFSGESDPGATADAVIALAAARQAGANADIGEAIAFLEEHALVYAQTGTGQSAKLVLAVVAAGGDPRDVNSVDPVSLVKAGQNGDTHLYGTGVFDHALSIMALSVVGEMVPGDAFTALAATETPDGSWAYDGTTAAGAGDSNTTAMVIQALVAADRGDDPMVDQALEYLKTTQDDSGAFSYQPADPMTPDANSTALVVQALIAAGEDPASLDWRDASSALLAFQNASGAFRYQDDPADDNLFATLQAVPAVAGVPFPVSDEPSTPVACAAATPAAELPCAA